MALLPAATRAAVVGLCRIAASASSSPSSAAAGGRRERELSFALAERGMVVGGHRGMGMNAVDAPPESRVGAARERENTLLSFGRAAAHAAVAFVEFDVQVTKDGCPIIFHDDFILTQGTGAVYERRVTDLLLEEFLSYGPQKESRKVPYLVSIDLFSCKFHECMLKGLIDSLPIALTFQVSKPLLRRTGDGRVLNWSTEEDDSLCTLQEVFECVSPRLGFNIELKFDDNILYQRKDLERALQAILQVLFLTEGGTSKHHDSRRNSLNDAIRVCLEYDLHGIVSEVRGVLKNPAAVVGAQDSNLALLTYGHLNNVWEAVYVQYLMGINGIIVDHVEEISNAVAGFSKPDLGQNGAGVDGAKHQAFSQQQLGFLLRLIPELIEHRH
ncbi:Glycerophosphodiester phosphodiesterase GDPD1, chloroplastic [Dichanthelium oligosanthes]|uniref:glycerophosphodiester phosphodiesterase n=1 Tax=Dichanthelium oligosanthes TaxID=888268 RepID=A0A1E5W6L7_9POAL|nr:Glycerophosphodiester phosphodiesterase GDPD1, chloroplastic [Dichanthelium oligosanthes]